MMNDDEDDDDDDDDDDGDGDGDDGDNGDENGDDDDDDDYDKSHDCSCERTTCRISNGEKTAKSTDALVKKNVEEIKRLQWTRQERRKTRASAWTRVA